jgi:hypothetical protein
LGFAVWELAVLAEPEPAEPAPVPAAAALATGAAAPDALPEPPAAPLELDVCLLGCCLLEGDVVFLVFPVVVVLDGLVVGAVVLDGAVTVGGAVAGPTVVVGAVGVAAGVEAVVLAADRARGAVEPP